jgi:hypothetical protein
MAAIHHRTHPNGRNALVLQLKLWEHTQTLHAFFCSSDHIYYPVMDN